MDIIAHSFKYALHDMHDMQVIWVVKVKVICGCKSEKIWYFDWNMIIYNMPLYYM